MLMIKVNDMMSKDMEAALYRAATGGACIVLAMCGLVVWDLLAVCIHAVTEVESGIFTTKGHDVWGHVTNLAINGVILWLIGVSPTKAWVIITTATQQDWLKK